MKKRNLFLSILIMLISFIFNGCNEAKRQEIERKERIIKKDFSKSMSFKYDDISEVIIYSFLDKEFIKQIDGYLRKDINFNTDVQLSNDFIKERIVLSENQKTKLFNLIAKDSCNSDQLIADCYNPRHQIVFKDKKDNVIGDIEICFSCGNIENSKSIGEAKYYCLEDMRLFFWNLGIKYFINDDHSGIQTEEEQKEIERIYRTLPKKVNK
ncbi:hypothetical protein [Flavobacterium sp.]|uniref:hypothetical protein n=1 Tax=Flavobacterium sp. TaxID=239 RepID=UPI0040478789